MIYDNFTLAFCGMNNLEVNKLFKEIEKGNRSAWKLSKKFNVGEIQAKNIINLYDRRKKEREEFLKNYVRI